MNSHVTADERRDLYAEVFYEDSEESWDFGQWLAELLKEHLVIVEDIMGCDRVSAPFNTLLEEEKTTIGLALETWREVFSNYDGVIWGNWKIGRELNDAALYGRFGVTREDVPPNERRSYLEQLVARVDAFYERSDLDRIAGTGNQVSKIVRLARTRWNLDCGEGDVDPMSLAILGGLSEGRIRNMMTGSDRVFENTGGKVSARSALEWLRTRSAFFDSIWEHEGDVEKRRSRC